MAKSNYFEPFLYSVFDILCSKNGQNRRFWRFWPFLEDFEGKIGFLCPKPPENVRKRCYDILACLKHHYSSSWRVWRRLEGPRVTKKSDFLLNEFLTKLQIFDFLSWGPGLGGRSQILKNYSDDRYNRTIWPPWTHSDIILRKNDYRKDFKRFFENFKNPCRLPSNGLMSF